MIHVASKKTKVEVAADFGTEFPAVIYGFDRVTVWINRPELPISFARLKNQCADVVGYAEQMAYQPNWKFRVEIFQPTSRCLRLLAKALGNDVSTLLTYVEIVCDVAADSKHQAVRWRNAFLASAQMSYQRQPVVFFESTCYYGRRSAGGNRQNNVLAVYADQPSKLHNARPVSDLPPCLHIEWRASASTALARLGIICLDDLIRFDHQRFWENHVRMYQLARPTALGRLLARASGSAPDVSGIALRKRAARWTARNSILGKFVMHNALLEMSVPARRLHKIPFSEWLRVTVSS